MSCRMAAAAVMGPDLLRRLGSTPQQLVRQGGLADARRSNEADGPVAVEILMESGDAVAGAGADRMNWSTGGDRSYLPGERRNNWAEVHLVEEDYGSSAAIARQREQALDARQIKIAIGRRHDEDDIDVGCKELRAILARRFAHQRRATRQHRLDCGGSIADREP